MVGVVSDIVDCAGIGWGGPGDGDVEPVVVGAAERIMAHGVPVIGDRPHNGVGDCVSERDSRCSESMGDVHNDIGGPGVDSNLERVTGGSPRVIVGVPVVMAGVGVRGHDEDDTDLKCFLDADRTPTVGDVVPTVGERDSGVEPDCPAEHDNDSEVEFSSVHNLGVWAGLGDTDRGPGWNTTHDPPATVIDVVTVVMVPVGDWCVDCGDSDVECALVGRVESGLVVGHSGVVVSERFSDTDCRSESVDGYPVGDGDRHRYGGVIARVSGGVGDTSTGVIDRTTDFVII